jgi:hypothetical protein
MWVKRKALREADAFGKEFGPSVAGAHVPLYKSAQLEAVIVKFMEVIVKKNR